MIKDKYGGAGIEESIGASGRGRFVCLATGQRCSLCVKKMVRLNSEEKLS